MVRHPFRHHPCNPCHMKNIGAILHLSQEINILSPEFLPRIPLHKWCARVDDDHGILYDIEELLEELEGTNIE